jgi:GSCFA family
MFYTKIDIQKSDYKIDYNSAIISLGSCFSENIGSKLQQAYFDIQINPFGVLFNPISIKQTLENLIDQKIFTQNDLIKTGSLWGSLSHSTLYSDTEPKVCLQKINKSAQNAASKLLHAQTLLITLGTAWVYTTLDSNRVVANCHKIPAKHFSRRRLTVNEIVDQYTDLIQKLKILNPHLHLIFTVSPVRHIKDGATENNISKGILLQATQELVQTHTNLHYFPSYEIMLDELRDYRFYAADMLHPSDTAINYIFDRFSDTFFKTETINAYNEIRQFNSLLNHRPLHQNSSEYNLFLSRIDAKKLDLIQKYPFIKSLIAPENR